MERCHISYSLAYLLLEFNVRSRVRYVIIVVKLVTTLMLGPRIHYSHRYTILLVVFIPGPAGKCFSKVYLSGES